MTMGMTTAMAVLPLVERPPLSSFCASCRPVVPVVVGLALPPLADAPLGGAAVLAGELMVDVMVMTCGGRPGAVADVMTTTEVKTSVEVGAGAAVTVLIGGALLLEDGGGAGGADDWAGGGALDGAGGGAGAELGGGDGGAEEGGGAGVSDDGGGAGGLEGVGVGVDGGGFGVGSGVAGALLDMIAEKRVA